ncbi:CMRF35-like molecule 2 [Thomomys bottae]
MWLSPALLLLCFRGCWSLTGPDSVTGTEGGSLHVKCQYDPGYNGYNKYWCKGTNDIDCQSIVQTHGSEEEVRNGRVSIRDSAANSSMVVTIENLQDDDAGPYWCKIQTIWILDALSRDPAVAVTVYVSPATTTPRVITTPAPLLVTTSQNLSIKEVSISYSWSLFSSTHFQILVLLKLLLLLSMLCAICWVKSCLRVPREESVTYLGPLKSASRELPVQLCSSADYSTVNWGAETLDPVARKQL